MLRPLSCGLVAFAVGDAFRGLWRRQRRGGTSPPPQIGVTVSPTSGSVLPGETLPFSATVSNGSNTAATWAVNSTPGGSAQAGTISADGVYTAPADLPQAERFK